MRSIILKAATRLLAGLMLVFAVYLLLRGHNSPGGGFAAALVATTAFALFAIAENASAVRRALRVRPQYLAGF
ncbi:MAG: MnhB domain-containing protein, partial [bacterium]